MMLKRMMMSSLWLRPATHIFGKGKNKPTLHIKSRCQKQIMMVVLPDRARHRQHHQHHQQGDGGGDAGDNDVGPLLDRAFECVVALSAKYDIDESHGLSHSVDVLTFAEQIFASELVKDPSLASQAPVIFAAAVLHDMCDKKYMREEDGIADIRLFMTGGGELLDASSMAVVEQIICTMSYSTVKRQGFPDLGAHQLAYHIVREADLLAAYDFDRCVVFGMLREKLSYRAARVKAKALFASRVMTYLNDGLFLTDYARQRARELAAAARHHLD